MAYWCNEHRPHEFLCGATPNETYRREFPRNRKPRYEVRSRWPRGFAVCEAVGIGSREGGCQVGTLRRVSRRSAASADCLVPPCGVKPFMLPCCHCARGAREEWFMDRRTLEFLSIPKNHSRQKAVTHQSRPSYRRFRSNLFAKSSKNVPSKVDGRLHQSRPRLIIHSPPCRRTGPQQIGSYCESADQTYHSKKKKNRCSPKPAISAHFYLWNNEIIQYPTRMAQTVHGLAGLASVECLPQNERIG